MAIGFPEVVLAMAFLPSIAVALAPIWVPVLIYRKMRKKDL